MWTLLAKCTVSLPLQCTVCLPLQCRQSVSLCNFVKKVVTSTRDILLSLSNTKVKKTDLHLIECGDYQYQFAWFHSCWPLLLMSVVPRTLLVALQVTQFSLESWFHSYLSEWQHFSGEGFWHFTCFLYHCIFVSHSKLCHDYFSHSLVRTKYQTLHLLFTS